MHKPITTALAGKSFMWLAQELIKVCPDLCQQQVQKSDTSKPLKLDSLAARIGELDEGVKLVWWAKTPKLTQCLVEFLGISHDDLALNQFKKAHSFQLLDAPDLKAIDLIRQEHWTIARPVFEPQAGKPAAPGYSARAAMGYWMSEHNAAPNTSKIECLYVQDDVEFDLITARLSAFGNNNVMSCQTLKDVFSNDKNISLLLSQKPLIISVYLSIDANDLYKLIDQRNESPLIVITHSPVQLFENNELQKYYRDKINLWNWILKDEWRWLLVHWVGQRLDNPKLMTAFTEQEVKSWLIQHDPNCQWFQSVSDVLRLCQIFSQHSERKLKSISNRALGDGLIELLFKPKEIGRNFLKMLIEERWKRWDLKLEGDLLPEEWKTLSSNICEYDELIVNKLIIGNGDGLNFKYSIVVRLILRDLLIEKIAQGEIHDWAKACFCPERRPILDAALDASSIEVLTKITRALEKVKNTVSFIGVVETLFIAIGRRIGRDLDNNKDVSNLVQEDIRSLIINGVISKLNFEQVFPHPWSRSVSSQSEQIEWVSACWAWSLWPLPEDVAVPNTWLFPGWSTTLSTGFPLWLVPRTQYDLDGSQQFTEISGYAKNSEFIAIVEHLLSKKQCDSITRTTNYLPEFFKIALLRKAAKGIYEANFNWWRGVLGIPTAETAVLQNFVSPYTDGMKTSAMNLWPSLVQYLKTSFNPNTRDLPKHWGRWTSKTSPIFQWVMKQTKNDTRKALSLLDIEACKFLTTIPHRLDNSFNLELLKSMAQRLPSRDWLESSQAQSFLINFGAEAVEGVIPFLQDEQLGDQAARCLWNWAPDRAEDLLRHDNNLGVVAKRNLIFNCPHSGIAVAIDVLQCDSSIFNSNQCEAWVHLRLPNAGIHSDSLWKLIATL